MNSMCRSLRKFSHSRKLWGLNAEIRRYLLSDSYMCRQAWDARIQAPLLKKFEFNELATQMFEKYEAEKIVSNVDMEVLSALMHQMSEKNVEVGETILYQHHHSATFNPVSDAIVEGMVRAYIDLDLVERLLPIIKNKYEYGFILNHYTANLVMDYFIKKDSIENAVQIAYEMMLQEDFSNKITYLLSLYACCKRLPHLSSEPEPEEEQEEVDEEEIQWKRVKVVRHPYYDDHFDIKDERHLLGKTLYLLGRETGDDILSHSLQFVGLGLWNKFPKALNLLQGWIESSDSSFKKSTVIFEEQLYFFGNLLEWAPTRDPDAPEKDFYARTIEDEIYKLRMTPAEKEECKQKFEQLSSLLRDKVSQITLKLNDVVEKMVAKDIKKHEFKDINEQMQKINQYEIDCDEAYEEQVAEFQRNEVETELINKLVQLAEKEELITSFDNKNRIAVARMNAKKESIYRGAKVIDIDEEEDKKKAKKSVFKKK